MATNETTTSIANISERPVMESETRSQPENLFGIDLALRLVLFACSVAAIVVLVTANQTVTIAVQPLVFLRRDAKFQDSPAFIYLLVALSVATIYSIITLLASLFVISKHSPSTKMLFPLIIFDVLLVGIMASATGSASSVAYIALNGNSHAGWNEICNTSGKFCRHTGASSALTLAATIVLVLLVINSAFSLYRSSR